MGSNDGGNRMNPTLDTRTLAEMFADMTDIFCDSVDIDGINMLLSYCLEASGVEQGVILVRGDSYQGDVIVGTQGRVDSASFTLPLVGSRALRTLQTEFSISGDSTLIDEQGIAVLQSIADIAATTIDQTHRIQQARTLVTQLQGALDSRIVIEQAKGVLAARNNTDMSVAFNELRSQARREQRPVRSVAHDIVHGIAS